MWPKFGNSSISMRDVIIALILEEFDQKTAFSEGWYWFKFNNLRLILGTNLKSYSSVEKGLKLKVRKFLGANSYVCRSYKGKTGKGVFLPPPQAPSFWVGLNSACIYAVEVFISFNAVCYNSQC